MAGEVRLNTPAPEVELSDYEGRPFRLADLRDKKHVFLVFNRGFT